MNRYYCDLHIHSCLSPCADNESTPASIAGMCALNGIQIAALTDHNSVKNCPAFFKAAKAYGVIPVAGMELTTAEDIHVICLFEELEDAMTFGERVEEQRIRIKNRVDIFGEQRITDEEDNILGEEEYLLSNATMLSLEDAYALVKKCGGICYPAHVDREANGIIATLGTFVESPAYTCAEFHDADKIPAYLQQYPNLQGKTLVVSSDAHYLWDIAEKNFWFDLDDEPYSSRYVRHQLFLKLAKGEEKK